MLTDKIQKDSQQFIEFTIQEKDGLDQLFYGGLQNLKNLFTIVNELIKMRQMMEQFKLILQKDGKLFQEQSFVFRNVCDILTKSIYEIESEVYSQVQSYYHSVGQFQTSRQKNIEINQLLGYIDIDEYMTQQGQILIKIFEDYSKKGIKHIQIYYGQLWRQIFINKESFCLILNKVSKKFNVCPDDFPLKFNCIQQFYSSFLQNAYNNVIYNPSILQNVRLDELFTVINNLQALIKNQINIEESKQLILIQSSTQLLSSNNLESLQFILNTFRSHQLFNINIPDDLGQGKINNLGEWQKKLLKSKQICQELFQKVTKITNNLQTEAIKYISQKYEVQKAEQKKYSKDINQGDPITSQQQSSSSNIQQSSLSSNFISNNTDENAAFSTLEIFETEILPQINKNWDYIQGQFRFWLKNITTSPKFQRNIKLLSTILHLEQYYMNLLDLKIELYYIEDREISGFTICNGVIIINILIFCLNYRKFKASQGYNFVNALISYILLITLHESAHYLTRITNNNWQYATANMTQIIKQENQWLNIESAEAGEIFDQLMFKAIFFPNTNKLELINLPYDILKKAVYLSTYEIIITPVQQRSNHIIPSFIKKPQ